MHEPDSSCFVSDPTALIIEQEFFVIGITLLVGFATSTMMFIAIAWS